MTAPIRCEARLPNQTYHTRQMRLERGNTLRARGVTPDPEGCRCTFQASHVTRIAAAFRFHRCQCLARWQ
jgi:hypothetical protein